MRLFSLFFSPTGTTRRIVSAFAQGFGGESAAADITLLAGREAFAGKLAEGLPFGASGDAEVPDLAVFAGPVYGGRSFKLLTNTIRKLNGEGRPAVCIVTYGGRHYDMALADLYDAAAAAGFQVIACGAFIGEHSFSKKIQTGRPDESDLAFAREFGQQVRRRLDAAKEAAKDSLAGLPFSSLPAMAPESIPQRPVDLDAIGMHRERLGHLTPNRPAPDENCLHCGACASVCPLGLIDVNDSDAIKPGCLKCNTCVKTCPVGSMQFRQEAFKEVARNCEETFGKEERSPQVWFG